MPVFGVQAIAPQPDSFQPPTSLQTTQPERNDVLAGGLATENPLIEASLPVIKPAHRKGNGTKALKQLETALIPAPRIKPKVLKTKPAISMDKPVQYASLSRNYKHLDAQPKPPKLNLPHIPNKLEKNLFGSVELKFEDERRIKAWSRVYDKFVRDTEELRLCINSSATCTDPALAAWARDLRELKRLPRTEKITAINTMVNRRSYASDIRTYGTNDYWASPREFLSRSGDCEDYAILKFASLMALGFRNSDLRIVVGTLPTGQPHAFLAVKSGGVELVLDNRKNYVYRSEYRSDYIPKYSMNLANRWSHIIPKTT